MHPAACGVGAVTGGCGVESCDSCAGGVPAGYYHGPVLQHLNSALTCGSGCGEVYWGEWMSDPPDACDPCDDCGTWTGSCACGPVCWNPFHGLRNLWGYRYASAGYDVGCATCGTGSMDYVPMDVAPIGPKDDGTLQIPEVPKPEPVERSESTDDQQAARRLANGSQVTHATYTRAR